MFDFLEAVWFSKVNGLTWLKTVQKGQLSKLSFLYYVLNPLRTHSFSKETYINWEAWVCTFALLFLCQDLLLWLLSDLYFRTKTLSNIRYDLKSVDLDICFAFCVSNYFIMIIVGTLLQNRKLFTAITKLS